MLKGKQNIVIILRYEKPEVKSINMRTPYYVTNNKMIPVPENVKYRTNSPVLSGYSKRAYSTKNSIYRNKENVVKNLIRKDTPQFEVMNYPHERF